MGSLTTTFTPPASCTSTGIVYITRIESRDTKYYFLQGQNIKSTECFPSGYDPRRTAFYEPGICPSGYTGACTRIETLQGKIETAVTCCPTLLKHYCQTDTSQAYPWQSTLVCRSDITTNGDGSWTIGPVTWSSGPRTWTEPAKGSRNGGAVNAYGIQIKIGDGAFPTMSSTVGAASSPSIGQDVSATAIRTGGPGQSEGGGAGDGDGAAKGLSPGAAAGIGVGAGAAVILAAFAGLWLLRRRRKDRPAAASENKEAQPGAGQGESPAELSQPFIGHETARYNRHSHKPENLPLELDATTGR
ncbi:hypothetical protein LZ31DRAFT_630050 [Colletotrichum somersetense]|nr:hypothetical protein LZ31DRAFT_630050 [Colletotrichum somersetense]